MLIDFHCHLDLYKDPHSITKECGERGINTLSVTTTPSAWKITNSLANGYKNIRTALGLHPQIAHERKDELGLFDELLPQTQYVGEVGLDGIPELRQYWKDQVFVFEHILSACERAGGRTLSIHSRRASHDVLNLLEKYPNAGIAILHWYSGGAKDLNRAISIGCWFSVGLNMVNGLKGRELILRMPRERVLTETDGPFTQNMGQAMMPWDVEKVTVELGKIWGIPLPEVEHTLQENLSNIT